MRTGGASDNKMRREKAGPSFLRLWRGGVAVIP